MDEKKKYTLVLGSNQGDSAKLIEKASAMVENSVGKIVKKSSLYRTEPWGFESENDFLNQIIEIESTLTPVKAIDKLLEIEKELGRVRDGGQRYGSRTIDIDILFVDNEIIEQDRLVVPHPRLHLRKFCLELLKEISPDFIHPTLGKSIRQLLDECTDHSDVRRIK